MITKLTLTIDYSVVEAAKIYARNNGKSLSGMVENYLKSITAGEETHAKLSPKVAKLLGSIKLPDGFDYKRELGEALSEKHKP